MCVVRSARRRRTELHRSGTNRGEFNVPLQWSLEHSGRHAQLQTCRSYGAVESVPLHRVNPPVDGNIPMMDSLAHRPSAGENDDQNCPGHDA